MHNSRVFGNANMYAEGTSPYQANIKIYGGSNNKIGYNNLDVGYSSHGIVVNNSTKGLLYCNHVAGGNSSAPSALEVKGECMGTEIRGNDISGSGSFSLTYGNPNSAYANTGNQPFKGNIFANSSPSSPKAVFYGNASLVENNRYLVAPINNQGNAYFPYNTAPTNNWFNNQAWGEDYTCPPGKPGLLSPEKQLDDLFSLTNLVDNSIAANYHPELEWGAKLKLYTFLSDYKTNYNTLPSSLDSRLTSMQGSIYAQFYEFDKRYMLAIEENEDERARNKILSDEVIRIMDEIDTIEWFELDTITGSFKIHTEQYGHYKSLKKEIRDLSLKLEDIQIKVQQDKLAALPSLQTLNNSIVSDGSVSAENLKAVNDIWINMSMNENSLTDSDVEQLKSIANQCATLGGEGVFRARSLLASIEQDNFEIPNGYNDDCLSSALGNNFEDNTASNTNKIMLSPNPATDYVYIVSEKAFGAETIEVRNKLGELVKRIKINPESNSHNFDVSNWNEGIYYLRVNAGEPMHKLTVIRQ